MNRKPIDQRTVKRLFASSGGICAFPSCNTHLVDPKSGALLGEMCHISAASRGGPRYDSALLEDDRNRDDNLIILCPTHHSLIDQVPEAYTAETLKAMKVEHEEKVATILGANMRTAVEESQTADLGRQVAPESIDFAIVVALQEEFAALQKHFPELKRVVSLSDDNRIYHRATVSSASGTKYRIVATLLPMMGNLDAAHATADLIHRWNPRYILVAGIAAGLSRDSQRLGDIIASESIVYYEPGKVGDDQVEARNRQFLADRTLLGALQHFDETKWKHRLPKRPDGDAASDLIPAVHVGPIASGEKVIASSQEANRLMAANRKLVGFEMESAGVASAAFSALKKVGFITIRSICDFADNQKNDNWHSYAANAAAAFLRGFIESRPVASSEGDWPNHQVAQEPAKDSRADRRKRLFSEFCTAMDMEDFKSFCFVLGVDVDELPGDRKSARVRELILLFERRGSIDLLEHAFSDFNLNDA